MHSITSRDLAASPEIAGRAWPLLAIVLKICFLSTHLDPPGSPDSQDRPQEEAFPLVIVGQHLPLSACLKPSYPFPASPPALSSPAPRQSHGQLHLFSKIWCPQAASLQVALACFVFSASHRQQMPVGPDEPFLCRQQPSLLVFLP